MRAEQRILHFLHVAFASLVQDWAKWIVKRVSISLWRVAKERIVLLQTIAIFLSLPILLSDTYSRFVRVAKVTALIVAGVGTHLVIAHVVNKSEKRAAPTFLAS